MQRGAAEGQGGMRPGVHLRLSLSPPGQVTSLALVSYFTASVPPTLGSYSEEIIYGELLCKHLK